MKVLSIAGLFIVIFVAAGFLAWTLTKPGLPVNRLLENAEGRQLDVIVQGKSGVTLFVDRVADGERFEIPIQSLGWKDRFFAMRLEEQAPPVKVFKKEEEPVDSYLASRMKEIKSLEEKKALFEREISSGTLSDILGRKRQEDVLKIDEEIKKLSVSMDQYRARNKSK